MEKKNNILTLREVKEELGIDFVDEATDNRLRRYIALSERWLEGSIGLIGIKFSIKDERAKQLALLIIEDLYDRKSTSIKEDKTIEKLKNDFIMQLKYEDFEAETNGNI